MNIAVLFILGWNEFNHMFENDILLNYYPENLGVLKGDFLGFGCRNNLKVVWF